MSRLRQWWQRQACIWFHGGGYVIRSVAGRGVEWQCVKCGRTVLPSHKE